MAITAVTFVSGATSPPDLEEAIEVVKTDGKNTWKVTFKDKAAASPAALQVNTAGCINGDKLWIMGDEAEGAPRSKPVVLDTTQLPDGKTTSSWELPIPENIGLRGPPEPDQEIAGRKVFIIQILPVDASGPGDRSISISAVKRTF